MGLLSYRSVENARLRRPILFVVAAAGLIAAAASAYYLRQWTPWATQSRNSLSFFTVQPTSLDITIKQNGELQSLENIDITCPVEGQNTIQQIVPEGSFIKKGQIIAVLDPTQHRQQLEAADLEREKAEGEVKWSKEQKALQEVKNAADLDAANSELALAKIDLEEYTQGEFPAQKREMERKLEISNLSLKRKEEELATSKRLMQGGFLTLSEVQRSEMELITAQSDQEKAASDLRVLAEYKHVKDEAEKQNKVTQAENKVARVKDENSSNLAQKISDLSTKEKQLVLRTQAAARAKEQFENCTILAPADEMVLYASSVERFGYRDQPIQAGTKVMQEQLLVRLPDVAKMKAVVNIPETRVTRLKLDPANPIRAQVSIVGLPKPVGATLTKIGILPDNSQMWFNPDAKDYPVDLTLDETPVGMKPGTTTSVTIFIDKLPSAIAVPIGAIYSIGEDHYVFVRDDPRRPQPCRVEIGQSSETMVQITSGLKTGQQVLLLEAGQGRELLDLAGIKPVSPTTNLSDSAAITSIPAPQPPNSGA